MGTEFKKDKNKGSVQPTFIFILFQRGGSPETTPWEEGVGYYLRCLSSSYVGEGAEVWSIRIVTWLSFPST